MSGIAMEWAYDQDLPKNQKLVLLALAFHTNHEPGNKTCWPSMIRLAKGTGLSKRTGARSIPQLDRTGLINIKRGGGRGNSNLYTLRYKQRHCGAVSQTKTASPSQETASTVQINSVTSAMEQGSEQGKNKGVTCDPENPRANRPKINGKPVTIAEYVRHMKTVQQDETKH